MLVGRVCFTLTIRVHRLTMNPLTNVKNIQKLGKYELEYAIPIEKSWHQQYKDSAWIFIGGLSYDLTEGDIICVFSQYGEVVNINLIRDHKTGKSKGFAFLCYENQRSTVLAVDNFNGMKLSNRVIRVDHVEEYKVPKLKEGLDEEKEKLFIEGCAPKAIMKSEDQIPKPATPVDLSRVKKEKKPKKEKKKRHHSSKESSKEEKQKRLKKTQMIL